MLPWSVSLQGRFDEVTFESEVLKSNPLHDPYQRPLWRESVSLISSSSYLMEPTPTSSIATRSA